jgi:hypothetical protein
MVVGGTHARSLTTPVAAIGSAAFLEKRAPQGSICGALKLGKKGLSPDRPMPERDRFQAVYSIYEEVMDSQSTAAYGWRLVFDIWTALKAPRSKQLGALFLLRHLRSVLEPVYQRRHSNEGSHPEDDGYEGSKVDKQHGRVARPRPSGGRAAISGAPSFRSGRLRDLFRLCGAGSDPGRQVRRREAADWPAQALPERRSRH